MTATVPSISACEVLGCDFNHDGCTAFAVTIAGSTDHAECATFIDTGVHGGLPKMVAKVGACQRTECVHNDNLNCTAPAIKVGPGADAADCLTFEERK